MDIAALTAEALHLHRQGDLPAAQELYRLVLEANAQDVDCLNYLGVLLIQLGDASQAIETLERAISLSPGSAILQSNLGAAHQLAGHSSLARKSLETAVALAPENAEALSNLGTALRGQGLLAEAADCFGRAVALQPNYAVAHSNLLLCLNYIEAITPADLFAEHLRWGEQQAPAIARPARRPTAGRPIRVGYVSPDLRDHSVSYFFEPLLRHHDPAIVQSVCYAGVARPDAVTARLQGMAGVWRSTVGISDAALADQIRADQIDILVDLAGHSSGNRLLTFARRPAPVQVTWLGYPNSTGLRAMDYRFVDSVTDPPGVADQWACEQLLRIPGGFLCYQPTEAAPEVAPPPVLRNGFVTFGSFNNPSKLTAATLAAWAHLLLSLPESRLLLKGQSFADPGARERFLGHFTGLGIAASRIDLRAQTASTADHLALYGEIDVALDPFPYNGATTTCEALWMGVPVVTLSGQRHAARVGASLLTQMGLSDWIAADLEDYRSIARALTQDPARLTATRGGLRARMAASSLCDGFDFARRVEALYRKIA
jgi:protein O-GlcNAc transferase